MRVRPGRRDRHRLRPGLLALEDRRLLATFLVTSTADSAPASNPAANTMRWAVEQANAASSPSDIEIELGTSAATITLLKGQLELTNTKDATTIYDGPDEGPVTISGNDASRVFEVAKNVTASVSGLTFSDGNTSAYAFDSGAGVYNDGGTLTLTGCTISGNSVSGGLGGGLENNDGKLEIIVASEAVKNLLKPKESIIREAIADKFNLSTPPNLAFVVREGYNKKEEKAPQVSEAVKPAEMSVADLRKHRDDKEENLVAVPADWDVVPTPEENAVQAIPMDWASEAPATNEAQVEAVPDEWAAIGTEMVDDSDW